jgi:hypothetical protein
MSASPLTALLKAQAAFERAERARDRALVAAKDAGVPDKALEQALGGASRWSVWRRINQARAAGLQPPPKPNRRIAPRSVDIREMP